MPRRAPSFCCWPGCNALTNGRYCETHKHKAAEQTKAQDRKRGTAAQRGYDAAWKKARDAYLRKHPLCVECESDGRVVAATVVDHKIPHKGDKVMFWDSSNWQSLCKPHHDRKTAREDGGFGNQVRADKTE